MAYAFSSVSSATVGAAFTATRWDDQVRANVNGLIAPPMTRVWHTSSQSLASGVWTGLNFNTEAYDTDGIHSTVSNSSRLTCQTSGVYQISGYLDFSSNPTGIRGVRILRDDSTGSVVATDLRSAIGTYPHAVTINAQYPLTTGQYVTLQAFQDSGSTADVMAANSGPWFSMAWLGKSTAM